MVHFAFSQKALFLRELFLEIFGRFWDKYHNEEIARSAAISIVSSVPAFRPDHQFWRDGVSDFLSFTFPNFERIVDALHQQAEGAISRDMADLKLDVELKQIGDWYDSTYPEKEEGPSAPPPTAATAPVSSVLETLPKLLLFSGTCPVCKVGHLGEKEETKICCCLVTHPGIQTPQACPGVVTLTKNEAVSVLIMSKNTKTTGTQTGRVAAARDVATGKIVPTQPTFDQKNVVYHDGAKATQFKGVCKSCEKVHYDSHEGWRDCSLNKDECLSTVFITKNTEEANAAE